MIPYCRCEVLRRQGQQAKKGAARERQPELQRTQPKKQFRSVISDAGNLCHVYLERFYRPLAILASKTKLHLEWNFKIQLIFVYELVLV